MPWENRTVEELRREFIDEARGCTNLSKLCREFGISRTTAYKWIKRAEVGEPLSDRSKAPKNTPHKTSEEIEQLILAVRDENPGWGGRTIHKVLENHGYEDLPCPRTFSNILKRNSRVSPDESNKRVPFKRFEKERCNQMWQTDFKGEFLTKDKKYCFPLTILDDHSRYSIKISSNLGLGNAVLPAFKAAFVEFGIPESVLSDNGAQFAGFNGGFTHFEKWLMDYDVLPT